jgi:hypothetical protein
MKHKTSLEQRIRGWLPRDLITAGSQGTLKEGIWRGIIVGYGVGFGVPEIAAWAAYLVGFYKSLEMFLFVQATIVGSFIVSLALAIWLIKRS